MFHEVALWEVLRGSATQPESVLLHVGPTCSTPALVPTPALKGLCCSLLSRLLSRERTGAEQGHSAGTPPPRPEARARPAPAGRMQTSRTGDQVPEPSEPPSRSPQTPTGIKDSHLHSTMKEEGSDRRSSCQAHTGSCTDTKSSRQTAQASHPSSHSHTGSTFFIPVPRPRPPCPPHQHTTRTPVPAVAQNSVRTLFHQCHPPGRLPRSPLHHDHRFLLRSRLWALLPLIYFLLLHASSSFPPPPECLLSFLQTRMPCRPSRLAYSPLPSLPSHPANPARLHSNATS